MIILEEVLPEDSPNIEFFKKEFGYPYVTGQFGVFIDDGKEIGAIDYDIYPSDVSINYILSLETFKGNARKMLEHLFSLPNIETISGGSSIDAEGFWKHVGATFEDDEEEEDVIEGYRDSYDCKPFTLHKTSYFNNAKECSN